MHPPEEMIGICDPIETWVGPAEGGQMQTISHWQMSAAELAEVNRNGGRVWVRVLAAPTPPIAVEVSMTFE